MLGRAASGLGIKRASRKKSGAAGEGSVVDLRDAEARRKASSSSSSSVRKSSLWRVSTTKKGRAAEAKKKKEEGNALFKKGNFQGAVKAYTAGLELEPINHFLLSNRAAAFLELDMPELAAEDARACVNLQPSWVKGYTRLATALMQLGELEECARTLEQIRELDPGNHILRRMGLVLQQKEAISQLHGPWYGKVHDLLGGYEQSLYFKDDKEVIVTVFDRSVVTPYSIDSTKDPAHLDLRSESGSLVKYIFKVEDGTLHLCAPYMTNADVRPAVFEGPGYVVMNRAKQYLVPSGSSIAMQEKAIKTTGALSEDEQCAMFAEHVAEVLPNRRIIDQEEDDELVEVLLAKEREKFQTSFAKISALFDPSIPELVNLYLQYVESPSSLQLQASIDILRYKMQVCGLLHPMSSKILKDPFHFDRSTLHRPRRVPGTRRKACRASISDCLSLLVLPLTCVFITFMALTPDCAFPSQADRDEDDPGSFVGDSSPNSPSISSL